MKQVGQRPSKRTGMCNAVGKDGKVYLFGGVMDLESADDEDDEDSDDEDGNFFNELYTVHVEGERATWHLVNLTGKKDPNIVEKKTRRRKDNKEGGDEAEDNDDMETVDNDIEEISDLAKTVTIESGNFTVSSTVGGASDDVKNGAGSSGKSEPVKDCFVPCARFNSQMVFKSGVLYLFGGCVESGEKDITLKDFYSLDTTKLDSWNTIIENDQMEWLGDDNDDDESDMDTD